MYVSILETHDSTLNIESSCLVSRLNDHDFLGKLETTVASIVGSRGSCLTRPISGKRGADEKKYGVIKVLAEEIAGSRGDSLRMRFSSANLTTKDWFGKGDKYLMIKRMRGDGKLETVHKTEVVKNSKEPTWLPIDIPLHQVCLGDLNSTVVIELWDWNGSGSHDYIGQISMRASELTHAPMRWKVVKPNSKSGKDRGEIILQHGEVYHPPSFLEYISGGCEINVVVAVDFTASNGDPNDRKSLHHKNPSDWNSYQKAIIAVGEILEKYSHDKSFDAYGFGAKLPNGQVSHCFPLKGGSGSEAAKVYGVQGLLDAYGQALQNVKLFGPTNFNEIVRTAHSFTRRIQVPGSKYFVLLIITDGEITDMSKTVDAIVDASGDPLSIVIVGVGPDDFVNMKILDGDDQALTSQATGRRVQRDIVQFVSFRDLKNNGPLLAKEVLYEIPDQLTSYMKSKNAKPMSRPQVNSHWYENVEFSNSFAQGGPGGGGGGVNNRNLLGNDAARVASFRQQALPQAPGMQAALHSVSPHNSRPPQDDLPPPPPYSDLPNGWEEKRDPSSGKSYYVNHTTKSTQWERPTAEAAPSAPPPYHP